MCAQQANFLAGEREIFWERIWCREGAYTDEHIKTRSRKNVWRRK